MYLGYDFLSVIDGQYVPNRHHLPKKGYWKLYDLEMNFQDHHRSLSLAVTMGLTCIVCLQKAIEVASPWNDSSRSSQVISIGAIVYLYTLGMVSYVINSRHGPNMHRLPVKGNWKLHDLEMIFQGHHRSYLLAPLYTLGMVSYLSLTAKNV